MTWNQTPDDPHDDDCAEQYAKGHMRDDHEVPRWARSKIPRFPERELQNNQNSCDPMERNSETVVAGTIVSGRNPGRCHEILIGHVGSPLIPER
jgi:hypothetical protein